MARSFTLTELETRLRQLTGTVNNTYLSQAEMWDFINAGIAETVDWLVQCGQGEFLTKRQTITTVAGQSDYVLATVFSAGDFYQLLSLSVQTQPNVWVPVPRLRREMPQVLRAPTVSGISVRAVYLPYAAKLTAGSDVFDGINGYEEYALMCAAISVKAKQEEDASVFRSKKLEIEARMQRMARRDISEPKRIVERKNKNSRLSRFYPFGYSNVVQAYDVVGPNLELYQCDGLLTVP